MKMSLTQTRTEISVRNVTGYLTDDGAFYESADDAERHEATYALIGAYNQYVGRGGNIERFQNVIIKPIALSSQAGTVDFHCPPAGHEGHGSLRPNETFATASTIRS